MITVGARVLVRLPKVPDWHEVKGLVVALHPPQGVPYSAVVRAYGSERIIPIECLDRLDNGAHGAGGSGPLSPLPEPQARGKEHSRSVGSRRSRKAAT